MKYHGDKVAYYYDKTFPKVDSNHTCLAVISLEPSLKKDKIYYWKVFLKECEYIGIKSN